jgi:hypothetical protein
MRFQAMSESIGPMCHYIFLPLGRSRFPVGPVPRYRTRRKEHALSIVRDEFRPAIPRSGWSPPEPVSASPTRASYSARPSDRKELSLIGNSLVNWLSQPWGLPHFSTRNLRDNVREALRSWYVKGESAEAICSNCNLTPAQFSEMKQGLRARFVELRGR